MPKTARMCSIEKLFPAKATMAILLCGHRAILGLGVGSAPGIRRGESNTHFHDSRNKGSCTLTAIYTWNYSVRAPETQL